MTPQPKCKWEWLKLLIGFLNFSLTFSSQFIKLQRHPTTFVRLLDHYKAIDNIPLMCCALQCHDDLNCVSINYNTATETCEMNDRGSEYGIADLMTEQNWDVYNVVQGRCSKGWLNYLGSCYWVEKERKVNWTEALSRCAALNAQLLKIESESENMFIEAELQLQFSIPGQHKYRVWMAGNDIDNENKWVWAEVQGMDVKLAAGGVIDFKDWAAGNPDNWNGEEHCLAFSLNIYKWNDGRCAARYYYICEV